MHKLRSIIRRFQETSALVATTTTILSEHAPLDRFKMICEREKIRVIDDEPITFQGLYVPRQGKQDCILLDSRMTHREREFVAFHELGHYFMRHTHETRYSEFDANFFAFLSLRPQEGK
jgi:Zn-dependent peptidase ImmA (M78 family)